MPSSNDFTLSSKLISPSSSLATICSSFLRDDSKFTVSFWSSLIVTYEFSFITQLEALKNSNLFSSQDLILVGSISAAGVKIRVRIVL